MVKSRLYGFNVPGPLIVRQADSKSEPTIASLATTIYTHRPIYGGVNLMGTGLLFLVGSAVVLFGIGILVVKYAEFLLKILVERKHQCAEEILYSGAVPQPWIGFRRKFPILGGYWKWRVLVKLGTIVRYFKTTPLVDDEESRKRIVASLQAAINEWKKRSWSELTENGGVRPW